MLNATPAARMSCAKVRPNSSSLTLPTKAPRAAQARDADDRVGGRAAGNLHRRAHGLVDRFRALLVDQRHAALGHALLGQEIVVGAREHIDDGVADAEDIVAKRGHAELDRLLWGRPALYLPFPPRQLRLCGAMRRYWPRKSIMSLARNVVTVGGATLLSRLLGFVRDVAIAAVLGAGALADAFFIALQIPNLFRRLLAEGALNSAFVPLWLRRQQEGGDARRAAVQRGRAGHARRRARRHRGAVRAVCAGDRHAAGAGLRRPSRISTPSTSCGSPTPYLAIVGLVAVMAATLNAAGRVGAAAYGPVDFQRGDDRRRRRHRAQRSRQLAGGRRDPRGRGRGRRHFPIAGGRRRDVPAARSADRAAAQRCRPTCAASSG